MIFISTATKTHEPLALVPLDLLRDVRSLFSLVSQRGGTLDRQARRRRRTRVAEAACRRPLLARTLTARAGALAGA